MKPINMRLGQNKEYIGGKVLKEYLVPEVEEDNSVTGVKPSTRDKDLESLHNKDSLSMTTKEEETLQEMEEAKVEVEELPIVAINEIS